MHSSLRLITAEDAPATALVVALDGAKDLRAVPALREELIAAMKGNASVTIDTRMLATLDTGVVQLLLAASRTARRSGREFSVIAEAEGALTQVLARLGLPTAFA